MGVRVLLLLVVILMGVSPAWAAQSSTQVTEATAFFTQVMRDTKNPLIEQFAQESLDKLREAQPTSNVRHQVEVPLLPHLKNSLAVQLIMNKTVLGVFAVDTGATFTVITPDFAKRLGIQITPLTPRMMLVTANGPVNAPVVMLNHVSLGEIELNNIQAIVQPLGKDNTISGLLGLNFFKNMDLSIKKNKLILETSVSNLN